MAPETNRELYERRIEPAGLKDPNTGKYENLRTTRNLPLLEEQLGGLRRKGPGYVLASWVSPPFGVIKGYGVYPKEEAKSLSDRSEDERWGFPQFGSTYDQERLERRIERLRGSYSLRLAHQPS